jgi:ABC-2 type transport system ATP-binding protein
VATEPLAANPAVETQGLTRRFGRVAAVDDLTITVLHGETLGLVGPDGAGKTTILRMLAAVLRPTSGWARVAGYDTHRQAERIRDKVGYMPQRFSLYGDLTVRENLDFFASIFGVAASQRQDRFARLLQFTGLEGFEERRAAHLSGGMQKKLGLACTLIHEPRILLLDEPTTGVDPVSRREFWEILSGLRIEGITIVVSTPYMDEAERCTRVGLMYEGRLVVCDSPGSIRALVPGQMIEVMPVAETAGASVGDALRRARSIAVALPGVLEAQTYGELLHLLVDDADRRLPEVAAALTAGGVRPEGLRKSRPRLEEAFISLVRRSAVEAGAGDPSLGR